VPVAVPDTLVPVPALPADLSLLPGPDTGTGSRPPLHFYLKTNLLYGLALLLNLSVEAPFDDRWSAQLSGSWSWWDSGSTSYWTHRVQWVGLGFRRWFQPHDGRPLAGHFAGVYASGGNYDLRLFPKDLASYGYQSRWSWSAGIAYGYVKPLSGRLSLEFSVSAGYFGGKYKAYNLVRCTSCYPERDRGTRHYFGPTSAGISLVYRFGGEASKAAAPAAYDLAPPVGMYNGNGTESPESTGNNNNQLKEAGYENE
jgi:hypothetical protein